jgi:hypothetical protein
MTGSLDFQFFFIFLNRNIITNKKNVTLKLCYETVVWKSEI